MSYYAAGSPRTLQGFGLHGFGALVPAATRGPIRASEIQAALARTAGYPPIQGILQNALASVNTLTEAGVAKGESLYVQAAALAKQAGASIAPLRDLSATASASDQVAATITKSVQAVQNALQAGLQPVAPTGAVPPPSTWGVSWFPGGPPAAGVNAGPLGPFFQPIGPLRVWQWLALGGIASVALGVAAKATRFAVIGGTVAAGAVGVASWVGTRSVA